MARHRHLVCVRSDGLSQVLADLLGDRRVVAATLVDADSGFVLDACTRDDELGDLELLGAVHADLARAIASLTGVGPDPRDAIAVVEPGDGRTHLLRAVPDPHGDRLVVAAVVRGGPRVVARARARLAGVPVDALTAGPTLRRRPVDGRWNLDPTTPDTPAIPPQGLPGLEPAPDGRIPVGPASMPPWTP